MYDVIAKLLRIIKKLLGNENGSLEGAVFAVEGAVFYRLISDGSQTQIV